jgi:hypothetical protein
MDTSVADGKLQPQILQSWPELLAAEASTLALLAMTNTMVYDYSRLLAQENSGALFYRSSLMRFWWAGHSTSGFPGVVESAHY